MKLLLLGTQSTSLDSGSYYQNYLKFFEDAIKHSGQPLTIVHALLDELLVSVGDGEFTIHDTRHDCDLSEYDMVFIRGHVRQHFDLTKAVSIYLKQQQIPVVNDYSGFRSSSKLIQAVQFHEFGVPVARTVFITPATVGNLDKISIAFPCILKATYGSHGNHNYLVKDADELQRLLVQNEDREFVLQRYVPNECDYRVLIIGREVMVIRRSAAGDSHLNNTSKGGKADLIAASALPAVIIEQSRLIAKNLDMTIAGVDVLYNEATGEHVFLEVNSQPQLMTGAYLAEKKRLMGAYLREAFASAS